MIARSILLGAAALMLASCGGGKQYPLPAGEATLLLSGLSPR